VEEAKVATRALVAAYESTGTLDPETPIFEDDRFQVFAPDGKKPGDGRLNGILHAYLTGLSRWQYVGFLAYVERDAEDEAIIEEMRTPVRDANRVATVVGFGPRFLHSTGQAYKGGPAGGVFLIITREPTHDLSVPGHKMRFGQVQIAQARGDGDVLSKRGRRVLRVHLKRGGGDLDALKNAVVLSLKA
jgi:transaldolase/glucose-6-phosphate isomerase